MTTTIALHTMNSTDTNITTAIIDTIVHDVHITYIYTLVNTSTTMFLFCATLSSLPREIEHIWFKPFSLPAFLYILTRYVIFIEEGLIFALFVPLGMTCNMLANAESSMELLLYVGIEGLLVARAYAMFQGRKIFTTALTFGLLLSLISILYRDIEFSGCSPSLNVTTKNLLTILAVNISVVFTNGLIFSICAWKVWGTWKLKREAGIQNHSLVSILLKQSILGFWLAPNTSCHNNLINQGFQSFVLFFSIVDAVISTAQVVNLSDSFRTFAYSLNNLQNVLSCILVADFTLELRHLNSAKIEASHEPTPAFRFTNIIQHVHQSFLVELATPEDSLYVAGVSDLEGGGNHDRDIPKSALDDVRPS